MTNHLSPYAPPRAPTAFEERGEDQLYLDTLPTGLLNAAAISLAVCALMSLALGLRIVLFTRATPLTLSLTGGHFLLAAAASFSVWGVRRGSIAAAVVGMSVCPLLGLLSLFALVTGALGGLMTGFAALLTLALLVVNLRTIGRMGRAHRGLKRQGR